MTAPDPTAGEPCPKHRARGVNVFCPDCDHAAPGPTAGEGCGHRGYPHCDGKRPCACPCHDAPDPTAGERVTPCRYSATGDRWESITWPGKPTAYPCAHNHAHCDAMGCVGHVDGMHTDAHGDVISHIGCDLCRPASLPAFAASTGTSEDVEALGLLALLTAHRPNVVTEPYRDPKTGDQFRTRVKCDGETCNFYREGPRYWSVMDEHTAHLASLLAAREAAARAEERERIARAIEAARHPNHQCECRGCASYRSAAHIAREGR